MSNNNEPMCLIEDPYVGLWLWPCDAPLGAPQPCVDGSTLFYLQPCTDLNPTLDDWCALYPDYPYCVTLGLPRLPSAGNTTTIAATGLGLLVAGMLCLLPRRRWSRCR